MLVGAHKQEQAWKRCAYPVPKPTRRGFRWKATALRTLHRWDRTPRASHSATIMVPALHSFMPAESVALGWLNEIDALVTIRQRIACATRITGWDVFTFHTQHNADPYYDTTIGVMHDMWLKEGNLSPTAVREAKGRFGKPFDYHRIQGRLVENLVFQSSLLDWVASHGAELPLRVHVIGTALLSALVSSGSISFAAAVESAEKFGSRWDDELRGMANGKTEDEAGWYEFKQVRKLIEGRTSLSMGVRPDELPQPKAPAGPFWYSPTASGEPLLISTAAEAASALETLNLNSWSYGSPKGYTSADPIRGWLVSPMHPMSRLCRWSVSNYLLATPASVNLFMDQIASIGYEPTPLPEESVQNRFRLSRMKVTGP